MDNETLEKMRQLRLSGMYNAFQASLETPANELLTVDSFVFPPIRREWNDRRNRTAERVARQHSAMEQKDFTLHHKYR